jgi:hypothetical protein
MHNNLVLQALIKICEWNSVQYTVNSTFSALCTHSAVKCNPSVTVMKSSPWRWPSRVKTCRSVLRLMIKLSLCIYWWSVFLYAQLFLSLNQNTQKPLLWPNTCKINYKENKMYENRTTGINPLKTKHICFIQGLSAYHAVNTAHFGYKKQSLNVL